MNNIKAYTDIEQSKKLAEILPIGFEEHEWRGRCTDNAKAKYEIYVKSYLDKKRIENK